VVQADSASASLPRTWRVQWLADSLGIQFTSLTSTPPCSSDTALADSIAPPRTSADSASSQYTAYLCASGGGPTAAAHYLVDLHGAGHGKLRVVALDPNDSTQVIESNEVSYNGGIDGDYAPAILSASRSHVGSALRIAAVGVGLDHAPLVQIASPDTSWCLPLSISDRTATSLTATAQVAADLSAFVLRVGSASSGNVAVAPLDADTVTALAVQPACVDEMKEINPVTHEQIQPKDFAFVASRDSFHVFYIRHDMNLSTDATEKIIGHKRSADLYSWFPTENTMTAISARTGTSLWDNFHVWAPTIIRKSNGDPTYYMLYTGVQDTTIGGHHLDIQRIGVATSTDLNVWTQDTTWCYSPDHVSGNWAERDSNTYSGQQFRDPFVMPAPDSAGTYLMFFVAGSHDRKPRMVAGVARSHGDLRVWQDLYPLWETDSLHSGAGVVESPHAFPDPGGRWSLYYTGYNFGSPNDSAFVSFEQDVNTHSSPIDADTTQWSVPDTLYKALGGDQTLQFWHASEYLNWAPGYEYLGAYDDDQHSIDIGQMSWHDSHTYVLTDSCPPAVALGVGGASRLPFALKLLGQRPSRAPVAFAVETPAKTAMRLAIYDVLGRRVRTLLDEQMAPGERQVQWDGRGAHREPIGPGVYFARLTSTLGQRVARVVLLR